MHGTTTTTYFGRKVAGVLESILLLHRGELADRLIADVQSGVVYTVVNFIGSEGGEEKRGRKISIAKRKQLAATLADKTRNTEGEEGVKNRGEMRTGKKAETFPPPLPPFSFPFLPSLSPSRAKISSSILRPPLFFFRTIFTFQALYNALLASMSERLNLDVKVIIPRNNFRPRSVNSLFSPLSNDSLLLYLAIRGNDFLLFSFSG